MIFINIICLEKSHHVSTLTDPEHTGPKSSDDRTSHGGQQSEHFIEFQQIQRVVDGVAYGCDLELSLVVSDSGGSVKSDEIDEVVEYEDYFSFKRIGLFGVFGDVCDDVGQAGIGGHQHHEKYSEYDALP